MSAQRVCSCRFCDRDDLTPQGVKSHETHCDENPNPGIPYDQQKELGILDEDSQKEGADEPPETTPNPDQSVSASASGDGLPPVERLSGDKSTSQTAATDGGEVEACPVCDHDEVLPADEAKEAYISEVEQPNPKAVLGYELADHACQSPTCAALWGEKYHEPLPMEEVVSA